MYRLTPTFKKAAAVQAPPDLGKKISLHEQ